eukprot:INCI5304.2.p1 GENE.INCI5304.2~~INCI5304.2.p1  ORF type:complete len:346 (-),score=77.14 INCI5304.2:179-1216(-)
MSSTASSSTNNATVGGAGTSSGGKGAKRNSSGDETGAGKLANSMGEAAESIAKANTARAVQTLQELHDPEKSRRKQLRVDIHRLLAQHHSFDERDPKSFATLSQLLRDKREEEAALGHPRIDAGVDFVIHCCRAARHHAGAGNRANHLGSVSTSSGLSFTTGGTAMAGPGRAPKRRLVPSRREIYTSVLKDAHQRLLDSIADDKVTLRSVARLLVQIEASRSGKDGSTFEKMQYGFERTENGTEGVRVAVVSRMKELLLEAANRKDAWQLVAALEICTSLAKRSNRAAESSSSASAGGELHEVLKEILTKLDENPPEDFGLQHVAHRGLKTLNIHSPDTPGAVQR